MRRYIIERDLPAIGSAEREALRQAAMKSNETLATLGPSIQWQESYVAADKTFCVYLAEDEEIIRRHSELSGFPANRITERCSGSSTPPQPAAEGRASGTFQSFVIGSMTLPL